jgi:hypothetical protein
VGFDYRQFERSAAIGTLARLGCSRAVLKHAACRYAIARMLPGDRRKALTEAGVSHKQLRAHARSARELAGFLRRIQKSPSLMIANEQPKTLIPVCCNELESIAHWIQSLAPFRPDAKDAALALALHVKQRTGQKRLQEIRKLLNAALGAAGLSPSMKPESLGKQISRADRSRAKALLDGWEGLALAMNQHK